MAVVALGFLLLVLAMVFAGLAGLSWATDRQHRQ